MADAPRHPLLNPVLRFTKDPKPEGISGGGKNAHGIKAERLEEQRRALATQFANLAAEAARRPRFDGRVVLYAAMFDDSLAPTWTPSTLAAPSAPSWGWKAAKPWKEPSPCSAPSIAWACGCWAWPGTRATPPVMG